MTAIDYINAALAAVKERQKKLPNFPLYISSQNQIEYIKAILEGKEKDKSELHSLALGSYASKEFETTDPELSQHLSNVNYIASQMASGLKVILPHEENPEYIKRQKRYKK
ncbi:hypothetical protein D781_2802 [Serratia sp. FGI94]|uniref:immunity protein Tsi6 family protein n=1 Tax=Serratia sp. FGI94 TaxID=671990 RepID=UPI0002A6F87B|nr:immunity protein Tsi6 family protein [Serratia sp. FGI94]AGB83053.1 hypothetical protein D781_2802 [Serratia sp. FGI94]